MFAVATGAGQGHQHVGFDGGVGRVPGEGDGGVVHRRHLRAQPRRHHLVHLDQRPQRRLADAGDTAARGQSQADRHRDRFVGIQQQRRQRDTRAQLVATAVPLAGQHRIAKVTQPFDVATHAAGGHLEPVGKLLARPHPARLEQTQQLHNPARRLGHEIRFAQS